MRVANGKSQVLDGPYADTKEQLGGYYLIDVAGSRRRDLLGGALPGRESRRRRSAAGLADDATSDERASSDRSRATSARSTADAVARRSYGKLVAFLAARTRDVAAAEDALVRGVRFGARRLAARTAARANPEGWLLTVARRKLIDGVRRRRPGEAAADAAAAPRRGAGGRSRAGERDMRDPRPAPRVDVRVRAPGDRSRASARR